ncbi:hypothetical protein [Pseudohalioglobus lutimaris]|uniref:hypothetical protein n=1 Tax=Pseudohalioglobus lutimaris TaxID=1737061 RepID=UPI0013FE1A1A|nr:hypothetical protein [Pseudohalioglobus lutimaris]
MEEVVVTAQKRSESLTDVPISIAAISAQSIEQTGVRRLNDIAEYILRIQTVDATQALNLSAGVS